jgi:hypothetical protein
MPKKKIIKTNKAAINEPEVKFDFDDMRCVKPTLLTRMLLWLAPKRGIIRLAGEMGYPSNGPVRKAHRVFEKAERIDVVPSTGGGRGFQIVFNGMFSLHFSQDGDHFMYDGFEMGEYEGGDVTIFDGYRN